MGVRDLIEHLDEEIKNQGIAYGQNTAATRTKTRPSSLSPAPNCRSLRLPAYRALSFLCDGVRSVPDAFNGSYERIPKSGLVKTNAAAAQ